MVGGIGYEVPDVQQTREDTKEVVYRSGDGTVPYHSIRVPGTWHSDTCNVKLIELPGCGHRGSCEHPRMFEEVMPLLGIGEWSEARAERASKLENKEVILATLAHTLAWSAKHPIHVISVSPMSFAMSASSSLSLPLLPTSQDLASPVLARH